MTTSMIVQTVEGEVLALPKTLLLQTSAVDRDMLIAELEARYSVWIGATVALEQNDDHIAWLSPERRRGWRLWGRYRQYLESELVHHRRRRARRCHERGAVAHRGSRPSRRVGPPWPRRRPCAVWQDVELYRA